MSWGISLNHYLSFQNTIGGNKHWPAARAEGLGLPVLGLLALRSSRGCTVRPKFGKARTRGCRQVYAITQMKVTIAIYQHHRITNWIQIHTKMIISMIREIFCLKITKLEVTNKPIPFLLLIIILRHRDSRHHLRRQIHSWLNSWPCFSWICSQLVNKWFLFAFLPPDFISLFSFTLITWACTS